MQPAVTSCSVSQFCLEYDDHLDRLRGLSVSTRNLHRYVRAKQFVGDLAHGFQSLVIVRHFQIAAHGWTECERIQGNPPASASAGSDRGTAVGLLK